MTLSDVSVAYSPLVERINLLSMSRAVASDRPLTQPKCMYVRSVLELNVRGAVPKNTAIRLDTPYNRGLSLAMFATKFCAESLSSIST